LWVFEATLAPPTERDAEQTDADARRTPTAAATAASKAKEDPALFRDVSLIMTGSSSSLSLESALDFGFSAFLR
jgi:hypothetical protein